MAKRIREDKNPTLDASTTIAEQGGSADGLAVERSHDDVSAQRDEPQPLPPFSQPRGRKKHHADDFSPVGPVFPHEGVRVVESHNHRRTGIAFESDKPPTREEKDQLLASSLSYDAGHKQWETSANEETRTHTERLARKLAEDRRANNDGAER